MADEVHDHTYGGEPDPDRDGEGATERERIPPGRDASRIFDEPPIEPGTGDAARTGAGPAIADGVVGPDEHELALLRDAARIERNASMVRAGRRIGGVPGAMMAGAMAALREIYEGPVKEEIPEVREHSGEPHDLDRDGVSLSVDGIDVAAPAQRRTPPATPPTNRRRSRIRRRR